jgi:hypothetical protein
LLDCAIPVTLLDCAIPVTLLDCAIPVTLLDCAIPVIFLDCPVPFNIESASELDIGREQILKKITDKIIKKYILIRFLKYK